MGFLVSVLINLPCVHEVVKARTRCAKAAAARVSSDMVLNLLSKMVALVRISREHAFRSAEIKQDLSVVPPNSTVFYELELVSFEKDEEPWDLNSNAEKIEAAAKKKDEGKCLV